MKKLETLGFKHFCMTVGNLPSSYVESLSYYECLLWLIKYLQEEVIPTVNNNSEVVKELQGLYLELKSYVDSYFDNLDVQDEINNKLDEMVEEGTLQEIIADYLNSKAVFGFDTVSDMVSSTNLINGSYAKTLGYHNKNDNGGALYKIRTINNDDTVDNGSIIAMADDTLIAELIVKETVNVKQFGAYGDGTHNDTTAIQNCINYAQTKKLKLLFSNDTYLISSLLIDEFLLVDGLNCTLKSIANNDQEYLLKIYYHGCLKSVVENINIDGNRSNNSSLINGLVIQMYNYDDTRLIIKNVKVEYCSNYGVYVTGNWGNTSVRGMYFKNLLCFKNKIGLYADSISDSFMDNSIFDHNDLYGCYLDNSASMNISQTKAYWNGGLLETEIDVNRLPDSAIKVTEDATPQSGKKYYTRTGVGDWQSPYVYTEFTGSTFDGGTTYYETNGVYKNHGNGLYLNSCTGTYLVNCDFQDNAGDGIYAYGGNLLTISNTGLDANGLIFDDNNQVYSYESQGLVPYFYGIYVENTIYTHVSGYANNFRYNVSGIIQRSGIYCNNVTQFTYDLISRLQNTNIDYKRINLKNFGGKINGISTKIPVNLSNITLTGHYEFNKNNWNGSYMYVTDQILYFKLIIDNNVDKMPTTANTDIGTVNAILRPGLVYTTTGIVSESYMDEETGVGYLNIDPNGHFRIKSDTSNCRALSLTGSYIIKD